MRTTKNRFEEVLFFSVLVILGLATATPCSADTIYNNLGTDNSYIINREYDTNFSFLGTTFVTTGAGSWIRFSHRYSASTRQSLLASTQMEIMHQTLYWKVGASQYLASRDSCLRSSQC